LEQFNALCPVLRHPGLQPEVGHQPGEQHLVVTLILGDQDAVGGLARREARDLALCPLTNC
jgi:hypothetical protein